MIKPIYFYSLKIEYQMQKLKILFNKINKVLKSINYLSTILFNIKAQILIYITIFFIIFVNLFKFYILYFIFLE